MDLKKLFKRKPATGFELAMGDLTMAVTGAFLAGVGLSGLDGPKPVGSMLAAVIGLLLAWATSRRLRNALKSFLEPPAQPSVPMEGDG
jgi:hypothetical protein